MKASVGELAENLNARPQNMAYGDVVTTSPSRNLSPKQFPKVAQPTDDNGWIGPLGSFGQHSPSGSLYGYGVPPDSPTY